MGAAETVAHRPDRLVVLDAPHARGQQQREGQIRVAGRVGGSVLDAHRFGLAPPVQRHAHQRGAVVAGPDHVLGRLRRLAEALVGVTSWLVTAVISRAWASTPAMNSRPTPEIPAGSSASWKALAPSLNSDRWVCMPEPCTPLSGLGMNVA